jgi:hypothetical protein
MRQSLKKTCLGLFVGLPAALLACGGSTAPSGNSAAGSYTAISFVTTGSSGRRDELLAGSTLVLNLSANGTTSGHLHIAASGANPVIDADMAGTWTQSAFTVTISQNVDTFVRNTSFAMSVDPTRGWDLYGETIYSNVRVQVLLKQG